VVACLLGIDFEYISCEPGEGHCGYFKPNDNWYSKEHMESLPTEELKRQYYVEALQANRNEAENLIAVLLSGLHAQVLSGEPVEIYHWFADKKEACGLAIWLEISDTNIIPDDMVLESTNRDCISRGQNHMFEKALDLADRLVKSNRHAVVSLAIELESKGCMVRDEVLAVLSPLIMSTAIPSSPNI